MNFRESFQMPRQSFPTDVTSPSSTQLPSSSPEPAPSPKPPQRDYDNGHEDEEEKRAAGQEEFTTRA